VAARLPIFRHQCKGRADMIYWQFDLEIENQLIERLHNHRSNFTDFKSKLLEEQATKALQMKNDYLSYI
jgi:hypothetical protein